MNSDSVVRYAPVAIAIFAALNFFGTRSSSDIVHWMSLAILAVQALIFAAFLMRLSSIGNPIMPTVCIMLAFTSLSLASMHHANWMTADILTMLNEAATKELASPTVFEGRFPGSRALTMAHLIVASATAGVFANILRFPTAFGTTNNG